MKDEPGTPSVLSIILTVVAVVVGFAYMLLWRSARAVSGEWDWEVSAVGVIAIVIAVIARRLEK
jgi:hypothetical protein